MTARASGSAKSGCRPGSFASGRQRAARSSASFWRTNWRCYCKAGIPMLPRRRPSGDHCRAPVRICPTVTRHHESLVPHQSSSVRSSPANLADDDRRDAEKQGNQGERGAVHGLAYCCCKHRCLHCRVCVRSLSVCQAQTQDATKQPCNERARGATHRNAEGYPLRPYHVPDGSHERE